MIVLWLVFLGVTGDTSYFWKNFFVILYQLLYHEKSKNTIAFFRAPFFRTVNKGRVEMCRRYKIISDKVYVESGNLLCPSSLYAVSD